MGKHGAATLHNIVTKSTLHTHMSRTNFLPSLSVWVQDSSNHSGRHGHGHGYIVITIISNVLSRHVCRTNVVQLSIR